MDINPTIPYKREDHLPRTLREDTTHRRQTFASAFIMTKEAQLA